MAVLSASEARANLFRLIAQAVIIGGSHSATAAVAHRSCVFFASPAYRFMGAGQKMACAVSLESSGRRASHWQSVVHYGASNQKLHATSVIGASASHCANTCPITAVCR